MPSIYNARSVVPADVTAADLVAIFDEFDLNSNEPGPDDFFQSGVTYTRPVPGGTDTFHAAAVACQPDGTPLALGYAPINLDGQRTWEFLFHGKWVWTRGWTIDPTASPMTTTEGS